MFQAHSPGLGIARLFKLAPIAASLTLAACGGGGGGGTTPTTPAPTVSLSASPMTVSSGASTALTWSSTNATSCTASGGWSGVKATSGTESSAALTSNTTFTLTCSNSAGTSASQSVTVTIATPTPVPVVTISANPTSVVVGGTSVITWSATNSPTSCAASGSWSGSKAVGGGTETVFVNATGTYSLTCYNAGGSSVTQSVTVTAVQAPVVWISVNPTSVTSGGTTTITWSSVNVTSCTASGGWSGSKATSGTETSAALNSDTTFTLSCTGALGTASQSATATVTAGPPPPATATLSASLPNVVSGGSAVLTWSSTNATSCTASNGWSGTKATSGTQTTGSLTTTTTFTLTCTGPGGTSAPQTVTVIVYVQPTVTLTANPTSVSNGGTTLLTWSSTDATSCEASGGWSGTKATAGTQTSAAITTNTTFTLTCTGPGGNTGPRSVTVTVPATAQLSVNATSVVSGYAPELTWSSTDATSCTASGGWSGTKATAGTETSAALTATTTFTLTCTGPGGSSAPQSVTVTVTNPPSLTVAGKIAHVRPATTASGLDYTTTETRNSRGVTVDILSGASGSTVLGTTKTDASGNYSVEISPTPLTFRVRAKAELVKTGTPSFDFRVLNNTSGNALYVLDSATQITPGATTTVNLTAPLGRSGTNGTAVTGTRASAPFAILDMLYNAKELLIAAQPTIVLSAVNVHWSIFNSATTTATCGGNPNPVTGDIGTTFFLGSTIPAAGSCPATPPGIYVLGDASDDTDEFDPSVIAHEFGHYYEDALSRSDSMGGSHALGDKSDIRLAFSEGWGNVFSGMVLNDATYRDSYVGTPPNNTYSFNMEDNNGVPTTAGAYNEGSVAQLLWDVFDGANDDALSLGFPAIHSVMTTSIKNTSAMGSIYVMFAGLAANNPASTAALTALMTGEQIFGSGEWGAGETNSANAAASADVLPMFYDPGFALLGSGIGVVSSNNFPDAAPTYSYNRLGARRYVRINFPSAGSYTITATGPAGTDIDFVLYRQGIVACTGFSPPAADGVEQSTCSVTAAEYTLEVYDCSNLGSYCTTTAPSSVRTPITVKVQ